MVSCLSEPACSTHLGAERASPATSRFGSFTFPKEKTARHCKNCRNFLRPRTTRLRALTLVAAGDNPGKNCGTSPLRFALSKNHFGASEVTIFSKRGSPRSGSQNGSNFNWP
jgi:hypothetical protein